ncbi:1-deoxy-D-xylulose-5-phosphate reductoisomerase [Stagnimonas aquatica]|uniref:1-deoxy-D-xylulose 5-phosphate reductoisomerase n=1 Tax=Stagnimonas aquatica TaxID=2689987 RepID=A0A3N0VE94_9GAMM|nr:1-deoxy-D-xylulose-5-phosphate reductoisomerase [Stagnimonas aquatica]ROH91002.1 1-deoxy-D-xylulose-5-phosphate reductoisomerase [Stagnimonas aquatica]
MTVRQRLVVLGATGSVGRSTLDVAARHPDKLEVWALSAHRDAAGLLTLCRQFRPEWAVLVEAAAAEQLRQALRTEGLPTRVESGSAALDFIAAAPQADQVMAAIAGSPGLASTLAALQAGKRVLIANKEPLVMAGALMMRAAAASGATVLPIDSEHNAIFQCLPAQARCGAPVPPGIRRVLLTASGGPFRETPLADLAAVTPEQAVRHPNWSMGRKISVDSATMMNKGLELIEAAVLYGLGEAQIEVVIHPESIIHSMVEYDDGSTLAQLGRPDMRTPIAHALAWPQRWESGVEGLDWRQLAQLRFQPADPLRFPALRLAREALRAGGAAPNVFNAANEVAVARFLDGRLAFTAIAGLVERVLEAAGSADLVTGDELEAVLAVDAWARGEAERRLAQDA